MKFTLVVAFSFKAASASFSSFYLWIYSYSRTYRAASSAVVGWSFKPGIGLITAIIVETWFTLFGSNCLISIFWASFLRLIPSGYMVMSGYSSGKVKPAGAAGATVVAPVPILFYLCSYSSYCLMNWILRTLSLTFSRHCASSALMKV